MAHTLDSALLAFGRFVREHYGIPPTARELQEAMGYASSEAGARFMRELHLAGFIKHAVSQWAARDYVLTRAGRIRLAELELGEEVTPS